MRGLLLFAAVSFAILVPAAQAQPLPAPALALQVLAPTEAVGPEGAQVTVSLTLYCPNPLYLMQRQIVDIAIRGHPDSVVEGPESVVFESYPCAQDQAPEQVAQYTVKLPADAPGSQAFRYRVEAVPRSDGDPVFAEPQPAEAEFTLVSPASEEPAAAPLEELANATASSDSMQTAAEQAAKHKGDVAEVPGPSWLVAILGLALAALRRR